MKKTTQHKTPLGYTLIYLISTLQEIHLTEIFTVCSKKVIHLRYLRKGKQLGKSEHMAVKEKTFYSSLETKISIIF